MHYAIPYPIGKVIKVSTTRINKEEFGFSTTSYNKRHSDEESLMLLQTKGIIEKYETSYTAINMYLRNFEINQIIDLNIKFRASYPVEITGLAIRAYDYYNPEVEGRTMPIGIKVNI